MCIPLLLDGMFNKCLFSEWCPLRLLFTCWSQLFCPLLKVGYLSVELYTSPFNYFIFWFMYFGTFVWCTYVLKSYSFLMHNLFSPSIYFQTICIFDSKLYSLWDGKNFSFYSVWQFLPFVWLCNPFTFNVIIDRSRCDISYLYYYFSHDFLCL